MRPFWQTRPRGGVPGATSVRGAAEHAREHVGVDVAAGQGETRAAAPHAPAVRRLTKQWPGSAFKSKSTQRLRCAAGRVRRPSIGEYVQ